MLQKASHDADSADVFRNPSQPRQKAADAADNQADLYAGLGGLGQLFQNIVIGDGVYLNGNPAAGALGDLLIDQEQQPLF